MIDLSVSSLIKYAAEASFGASLLRVALHWTRGLVKEWVSPASRLWLFYDKMESTLSYISISLAAYGQKTAASTLAEPITKAAAPAEGRIVKSDP